jgi:hypothetical protein
MLLLLLIVNRLSHISCKSSPMRNGNTLLPTILPEYQLGNYRTLKIWKGTSVQITSASHFHVWRCMNGWTCALLWSTLDTKLVVSNRLQERNNVKYLNILFHVTSQPSVYHCVLKTIMLRPDLNLNWDRKSLLNFRGIVKWKALFQLLSI